jgi:hypothetical protein
MCQSHQGTIVFDQILWIEIVQLEYKLPTSFISAQWLISNQFIMTKTKGNLYSLCTNIMTMM